MSGTIFNDKSHNNAFVVLSLLFLMWGLITVITGFLVPKIMIAIEPNYVEAVIIAISFYGTYIIVSLPAGKLIDRVGFKKGIIAGTLLCSVGCWILNIAASDFSVENTFVTYTMTVISLITIGSGITILQVGANPYVFLLGLRGRGTQRLTFVQAFNSMGTVIATLLAGVIVANVNESLEPQHYRIASAQAVVVPFMILGTVMLALAVLIWFVDLPKVITDNSEPLIKEKYPPRKSVLEFPHVVLGCLAMFLYVGAEVSIFRYLLTRQSIAATADLGNQINTMLITYWVGMMAGRFAGAKLLSVISPRKMMTICALGASMAVIVFISIVPAGSSGELQGWAYALWILTATGIFNSILFPCIFSMGMDGMGKFSEEASGLLVMSVCGGAVVPFIVFELLSVSVVPAFGVILFGYLFIAFFGIKGSRYEKRTNFY